MSKVFMDTTNYRELFIEAMLDAQEFVEELNVIDELTGYDDMVTHPFKPWEVTKLNDLFESIAARHLDVTEDMIVDVLSKYTSIGAKKLNYKLKDTHHEK